MANDPQSFMKDVLAAPLGEIISAVGAGVAEAQAALDAGSLAQTMAIFENEDGNTQIEMLREIGYQPTFYAIPETEVEAQVSLAMSYSENGATQGNALSKMRIYGTPTNAAVTNAFNVNVQASAKIKFKIVAVPPPVDVQQSFALVPDLKGKPLAPDVKDVLNNLGFDWSITNPTAQDDSRLVSTQSLEEGKYVRRGTKITITLV